MFRVPPLLPLQRITLDVLSHKVQPLDQHEQNKFTTQTKQTVNRHNKSTYFTYLVPPHHPPFMFYKKNSIINYHIFPQLACNNQMHG